MKRKDHDKNNDFVRNVMARTAGAACERACEQLPDLADGHLQGLDKQLVQAHLEHCTGCRSVAVVLGWVQPMLSDMAELDPGPAFTQTVVARTSGAVHPLAKAARRGETVGPLNIIDRMGRWWQKQIFRPRFALEVAYVATVILVLLTSIPGAPLQQEARMAHEMVQAGPRSMPLVGPMMTLSENKIDEAVGEIRGHTKTKWQNIQDDFESRLERCKEPGSSVVDHIELAWVQGRSGRFNQVGFQLMEALKSIRLTWNHLWLNENKNENENIRVNPS